MVVIVGVENTGAAGGTVSIVGVITVEAEPVLPAPSVAVAVRLCAPSAKVTGRLQVPSLAVVVVPNKVEPSKIFTVLPTSAVPLIVVAVTLVIAGETGAVTSIVRETTDEAAPVLPAASVAFAVIACAPSLKASVGVKLHLPSLPAVVVPNKIAPS